MCTQCGYQETIDTIDDMIVEDRYQWALDTIEGIYTEVVNKKHVTDRQLTALENIRMARRGR
jgi:hypothetical protein